MLHLHYEDTSDSTHHALAGGVTGLAEYSIMYPIDLVKTRMQALKPRPEATYQSLRSCILRILRDEGGQRFFRGLPAPFIASVPAHALYYVIYEKAKRILSGTEGGYDNPVAQATAGAMAIVSHNILMNPADVIKQRMQVYDSSYKSSFQCYREILRKERLNAFYRSLPTQLAIDAPYGCLHFVVYEFCQNISNPLRRFDPVSHIVSGAVAGGIAAAVTNPLDVCRTLINTQEGVFIHGTNKSTIKSLSSALAVVYKTRGVRGFFRGLTPRVLHNVPSMAFCWIIYEFIKRYLSERDKNLSRNDETFRCRLD